MAAPSAGHVRAPFANGAASFASSNKKRKEAQRKKEQQEREKAAQIRAAEIRANTGSWSKKDLRLNNIFSIDNKEEGHGERQG